MVKNMVVILFSNVYYKCMMLILSIILARRLGAEDYGVYVTATSLVMICSVLIQGGFTNYSLKVLPSLIKSNSKLIGSYISKVYTFNFLCWLVILFFLMVGSDFLISKENGVSFYLYFVPILIALTQVNIVFLRCHNVFIFPQLIDTVFKPTILLLMIYYLGISDLKMILVISLVLYLISLTFILTKVLNKVGTLGVRYETPSKEDIKLTTPFFIITISTVLMSEINVILISYMSTSSEAAYYKIASQGAVLVSFALGALASVVYPEISKCFAEGDMDKLKQTIKKSTRISSSVGIPIFIVTALFTDELIEISFGEEYYAVKMGFIAMTFTQVINALTGMAGAVLNMCGHVWITTKVLILSALVNVVGTTLFVPYLGWMGAIYSSLLSVIFWKLLLVYYCHKKLNVNTTIFCRNKLWL